MREKIKTMFYFRRSYFIWTVVLLAVEIVIAVFIRDTFIRPHLGDVLVVMLVYCFLRAFFRIKILWAAFAALLIAFAAELGQYYHLTHLLGIQDNKIASGFFGDSFDLRDLAAYTCGVILMLAIEYFVTNNLRDSVKNADRS